MRRTLGLAVVLLAVWGCAGCSTAVLETRHGANRRPLAGQRTLVVADVAEAFRAATEEAAAKEIPGAVPAHRLPGTPTAAGLASITAADWDAIVVFTYAGAKLKFTAATATMNAGAIVTLDLDVSVKAPFDRSELWGERVRYTESFSNVLPTEEDEASKRYIASSVAPTAAAKAAKRLAAGERD